MKFATLLALSSTAAGLAFDGPLPTPVTDLAYAALTGVTPRPTDQIRALPDLFRRQNKTNPAVCGFLNGDAEFPLSCTSSSTCFSLPSSSWFGCCAPGSSCAPTTRCIASASVSSCLDDASCYNDAFAIACTASSAPSCVNMAAGQMSHWVCGPTATSVNVLATATGNPPPSSRTSDASVIRGDAGAKSTDAGVRGTVSATGGAAVETTSVRVGGGAVQTAGVVLGGLAGFIAVFL